MFGYLGEFALGFLAGGLSSPLVYNPISRVMAGGFSSGRPVEAVVLGVDLVWENDDLMVWEDNTEIGWEA